MIVGGEVNIITESDWATISGGGANYIRAVYGTIGGGRNNNVQGANGTVGGGATNTVFGSFATVPGVSENNASGAWSIAMGHKTSASHRNSFVLGDGSSLASSWGDRTFTVRSTGGARFYTAAGTATGVRLTAGGTAWASLSDRAAKQDFQAVDKRAILKKVAELPVASWTYKTDVSRRYIGPMAQDFHSTFGLGDDDKSITTLDADGVLLASVQGLVEELQERDRKIQKMETEMRELKARVDSLSPPGKR